MDRHNAASCWIRGKCIGRGSFGTVSLAVRRSGGRAFAVKSVDRSSCAIWQLESLENEIRILKSLSSPFVVEYMGDDVTREPSEAAPTTSFVRNLHMEYLPGGTAAEVAAAGGALAADVDERLLRSYVRCVASALRYLHSRGIAHCDVKGRNVLVGGLPGVAKLADFGSAVEFSGDAGAGKSGIWPHGSPLWMAPEVIRGEKQGPESDVWSLGCTVIEMVTGKPPWEGRAAATLRLIGFSSELPQFPGRLSDLGRDFLDKCLRREAEERWGCDRLLQHPFLDSADAPAAASSPRCVLESRFSDSDEEEDEESRSRPNCGAISDCEEHGASAEDRIRELATNGRAIWESDGWEAVRMTVAESWTGGTRSEYSVVIRTTEEGSLRGSFGIFRSEPTAEDQRGFLLIPFTHISYPKESTERTCV